MSWLGHLGFDHLRARARPPRIGSADDRHAARLAAIHACAFARPWGADEFETFGRDPAIVLDALFLGSDRQPSGFAVSRVTLDEAEILSVALDKAARGAGHSRLLLLHHLLMLEQAGAARVHLEVEDGNKPALALYERCGFAPVGRRPGYYTRPDGTKIAAISMTKVLADRPAR